MKPTITFDLDDTVCEFAASAFAQLNTHYGRSLLVEDNLDYKIHVQYGISLDEFFRVLYERNVYEQLAPSPGMVEVINELSAVYNIQVLTARALAIEGPRLTSNWISQHQMHVDIMTIVGPDDDKADHIDPDSIGLVEDNFMHLKKSLKLPMISQRILVSRPWNLKAAAHPDIKRTKSTDLPQLLRDIFLAKAVC